MTRLILIGLCAAAALLAGLDYRHFAAGRERALERIDRHGLDRRFPELRAEVRRRYDPVDADLRVARALLNTELDRSWMAGLTEEQARLELERGRERLAESAAIARAAWPRRAASWQAPLVLGGATYLELYRVRDPRLMAEPELWERPLEAARRLAPAQTGPVRFLTAAYLGNWASLTGDRRAAATELMARAFLDRDTYRLLIRDWLRVAPSRRQALALVPERPWAWQILQQIFSDEADWELYVTARRRWYESLGADLDRTFEEIRVELEGGEARGPRGRLLQLIQQMPRSLDFAPRLERALELLPPGPAGSESARGFAGWLDWALELCLLRECPLEPPVVGRLARLAGDPPPPQRAQALLIGGDLPRAELLERRFGQSQDQGWSDFHLLKAEHLARAGRHADARESLRQLPRSWQSQPRYWIAVRELARRRGDAAGMERAEAALDGLRRPSWPAAAWTGEDREMELILLPSAPASGLVVEIADGARGGGVVELFWDGRLVEIGRVTRATATFRLELPISPELHRLTLRVQTGGAVRPVAVELI